MDKVLYIGKFQPFHKGHQKVVERLIENHDELIIVIGGADSSYTKTNPFTSGERIEMIKKSIDADFKDVYVIPIIDIEDNILWPNHVDKYTPEFDCVYSNNPLVQKLFTDAGYIVKEIDMVKRDIYTGTNVRNHMKEDNDKWKNIVPMTVEKLIEEFNGVERLQLIHGDDYK